MKTRYNIMGSVNEQTARLLNLVQNGPKEDLLKLMEELIDTAILKRDNVIEKQLVIIVIRLLGSCCKSHKLHTLEYIPLMDKSFQFLNSYYQKMIEMLNKITNSETINNIIKVNISIISSCTIFLRHVNSINNLVLADAIFIPVNGLILEKKISVIMDILTQKLPIDSESLTLLKKLSATFLKSLCEFIDFTMIQTRLTDNVHLVRRVLNEMVQTKTVESGFWLKFMNLLDMYGNDVKGDVDVTELVIFLSNGAQTYWASLYSSSEPISTESKHEYENRILEINKIYLDVIVRSLHYGKFDVDQCNQNLSALLFSYNRYFVHRQKISNFSDPTLVEQDLHIVAEDLFKKLMLNANFFGQFQLYSTTLKLKNPDLVDQEVAWYLCIVMLLKSALALPDPLSSHNGELYTSMLTAMIGAFFHSETVLCANMKYKISHNGEMLNISLYDSLLVHFLKFFLLIKNERDFLKFENALLLLTLKWIKNVLKQPMAAMFISDLWFNITQNCSSEFRQKTVVHFSKIISTYIADKLHNNPNVIFLCNIIKRIFSTFPNELKIGTMEILFSVHIWDPKIDNVSTKFSKNDLFLLYHLYEYLPSDCINANLFESIVSKSLQISSKENFCTIISSEDSIFYLVNSLKCIAKFSVQSDFDNAVARNEKITSLVMTLWNSKIFQKFSDELFAALCQISTKYISILKHSDIITILNQMSSCSINKGAISKLCIIDFLKEACLVEFDISTDNEDAATKLIGSVFNELLSDENLIVHQRCLTSFVYIAHVTKYEKIISATAPYGSKANEITTKYLEKYNQLTQDYSEAEFFNLIKSIYYFTNNNEVQQSSKRAAIESDECIKKKFKIDENNSLLENAYSSLVTVCSNFDNNNIKPNNEHREKFKKIYEIVGKFCDKFK